MYQRFLAKESHVGSTFMGESHDNETENQDEIKHAFCIWELAHSCKRTNEEVKTNHGDVYNRNVLKHKWVQITKNEIG